MKKIIITLSGLLGFLGFVGCEMPFDDDDDDRDVEEQAPPGLVLTFGTFYGMCEGEECVEIFKIENDLVYEDTLDNYPGFSNMAQEFEWVEFDGGESDEAFEIIEEYNEYADELWALSDSTFGCPDCRDQGGIFFRMEFNGDSRTFIIDTDAANKNYQSSYAYPEPIEELAEEIMEVIREMKED